MKKISSPVKCYAFDSPLVRGGGNGGGKPPPYPNPVFRSFQKHPHKPQFVILSEAKDLQ